MQNHRNAKNPTSDAAAVLMNQEKAYDRVHPKYLRLVFKHLGFSDKMNKVIQKLFFGTSISISINGFSSALVLQERGLRLGDSLSPLLFNIAFEPLLRTILASNSLAGVSLLPVSIPPRSTAVPKDNVMHNIDSHNLPRFKMLSYADDLEVFLASPDEWPYLQEILQCYSRASNAKVNIHKTELVSLSGIENDRWKEISSASSISYHTTASANAVRYLGYPLYSNQQQLDSFLDIIEKKIETHAFLLKSRSLSVRISSLVSNSLLLSRLWHILRLVPVPNKWLLGIRQIIRKFVLPFWPAPSWDQICLAKTHRGLGVVDPQVRQITLQLIYLRRLIQPKSKIDFVSPLIGASLYIYTGHKNFLPWLQYSSLFLRHLKKLSTMQVLTKLIIEIPPLLKSSSWSGSFLAGTPLCVALNNTDLITTDNTAENTRSGRTSTSSNIPLSKLVSDVIAWYPNANQYHNVLQFDLPKRGITTTVYRSVQQSNSSVSWMPQFLDSMPANSQAYSYPPENTVDPNSINLTYPDWVLTCQHWYIYTDSSHKVLVSQIRNGAFRLHIQIHRQRTNRNHKMFTTSGNIYTPYSIPPNYLLPKIWKKLWALPLPHKVTTVWWRLLHNKVAYRKTLYRWRITSCITSLCIICRSESETNEHFFVSCFHKWKFWKKAIADMNFSDTFSTPKTVWAALYTLHDKNCQKVPEDILLLLGTVLEVVWRYHWRCIFDETPWIDQQAIILLETSISRSLNSIEEVNDISTD